MWRVMEFIIGNINCVCAVDICTSAICNSHIFDGGVHESRGIFLYIPVSFISLATQKFLSVDYLPIFIMKLTHLRLVTQVLVHSLGIALAIQRRNAASIFGPLPSGSHFTCNFVIHLLYYHENILLKNVRRYIHTNIPHCNNYILHSYTML